MLRGYRFFIFAFGLILLGASPPKGQYTGGEQAQAQNEVANALKGIDASIKSAAKPDVTTQPCAEGERHRNSDLCAQWYAADAASSAALAAWLVGGIGVLVGGATLVAAIMAARWAKKAAFETEKGANAAIEAVGETREANQIARDSAVAQLRPYLHPEDLIFRVLEMPDGKFIVCNVLWRNAGTTPAVNIVLRAGAVCLLNPITEKLNIAEVENPKFLHVAPNGTVRTIDIRIPFDDFLDIFNGVKHAYILGTADYGNLLRKNDRHGTDFLWKITFICKAGVPPSGDVIDEIRWSIEPFHNSIT